MSKELVTQEYICEVNCFYQNRYRHAGRVYNLTAIPEEVPAHFKALNVKEEVEEDLVDLDINEMTKEQLIDYAKKTFGRNISKSMGKPAILDIVKGFLKDSENSEEKDEEE